jgi:2-methylisocitrate lyase-like PEP mutase family enzyme
MSDLAAKASQLLRLHHTGSTLVLPTVWDAWSAAIVVQERCRHDIDSDA